MKTWKQCALSGYHGSGFVATHVLGHMMYGWWTEHHVPKCISCHKTIVVITGRAHCSYDCICIYITHILLLWNLSTLCVMDQLWPLIYMYIYIYCECCIELASRSWSVLFTLISFLYIHSPLMLENKKVVVITVFLNKLYHRSLFNYMLIYITSVKIDFNMINKRHTLPIVCTQGSTVTIKSPYVITYVYQVLAWCTWANTKKHISSVIPFA